jgi:uncharacterized surface protein with fasciclin (FAS1) repeats
MKLNVRRGTLAIGVAFIAFFGAACSSSDEGASSGQQETTTTTTEESTEDSGMDGGMADPAADLVGPGCAGYAEQVPEGPGSVSGMAADPVAVAASNNPLLKTLVQAVSGQLNPDVNLVDTLNGGEFTVFAPVDDAFGKIDPATIETLKTDSALLTKILTYHVVPGQLAPDQVVGEQTTVEKGMVDVTGSGDALKVNDANVICGGVHTANATVYLIDSVLMPTA